METEKWLERDKNALAGVLPRYTDLVIQRGVGSWVWNMDGKKYLDLASGIATCSTGHCNHKVVDAIHAQSSRLIHNSVVTHNIVNVKLAEKLGEHCPFFEEPQVFFCNSGAEAVDGSLKLARNITGNQGILGFYGAFHGRTIAATSITHTKRLYRDRTHHLPFVHHRGFGDDLSLSKDFLEYSKIGAIIVEPILGEGGYILPKEGWLQHVRETADELGALLIFDEVQTGAGRTGSFFAAERFGVTPDVILFAKGIASGMPLGGFIAERRLMDLWPTGSHGSTFGGNPVSCAAGLATIDIIDEILPSVTAKGDYARERLTDYFSGRAIVRGIGLMIAIEFDTKEQAENVRNYCLDHGVIVITCGPDGNIIRLVPALNIFQKDWEIGLAVLEVAVDECL